MAAPIDFMYSEAPEPHKQRTRDILAQHPEVRTLIGRTPATILLIIGVIFTQLAVAWLLHAQPWWTAPIAAWLVGAFASHMSFVLIHECSHNLIFKKKQWNIVSGIAADLVNVVPSSVSFRSYHLRHHSHQGDYDYDADLANRWEARFIGHSFAGKALWLLLFPLFQALRPPRLKNIPFINGWTIVNMIAVVAFDAAVILFLGPTAFLYLVFSFFFSIGLHPLGARWIQEHYLTYPPQETYSYYGPLNIPALNVGYHNEHHDFPSVPWNRLPRLKAMAPEFYSTLHYHTSWSRLLLRFIFDPQLSLFSRMVRK
ncbi:MAG: fatty acid desaturase [Bacteroidetes bacterium]|nr:fatty acid desaturase [Bacteroidota bacterium]